MAQKKITEYTLRDNVTDDLNYISDDGVQTYRVTAAQIKAYVLSLASIATTMIQDLAVTTGKLAAGAVTDAKTSFTPPTMQKFTGSGTYTTPAGVKYIRIRMVGGGGGGAGSGSTNGTNATSGNSSTFGSSLLQANGGGPASRGTAGAGGSGSIGTGPIGFIIQGAYGTGTGSSAGTEFTAGGAGGNSFFGGGGFGNTNFGTGVGGAGIANTGGGGGGGGSSAAGSVGGGGGGAGGYVEAVIYNPSATYPYNVGSGGNAGGAGTSGYAGGAGGSGYIIVEEYYQ